MSSAVLSAQLPAGILNVKNLYHCKNSTSFVNLEPHNSDHTKTKTNNESKKHKDITIIVVRAKSKELADTLVSKLEKMKSLTSSIINFAEMSTGTPCSVSWIIRPEPTSLTESASRLYFSGHNHCNHRRTGGIEFRWTKKPAYVIWYKAVRAESKMAMPPFWNRVPSKKFYRRWNSEGTWGRRDSSQRGSSLYYRAPKRKEIWRS